MIRARLATQSERNGSTRNPTPRLCSDDSCAKLCSHVVDDVYLCKRHAAAYALHMAMEAGK